MRADERAKADAFVPRQLRKGTTMVMLGAAFRREGHEADADCERYGCVPARWVEEHENETEER